MRSFLFAVSLFMTAGCQLGAVESPVVVVEAELEAAAEECDWGHCGQQYNCAQNPAPKASGGCRPAGAFSFEEKRACDRCLRHVGRWVGVSRTWKTRREGGGECGL